MSAGWWLWLPFPGCLPVMILLPLCVALGRLREHLWPPPEIGGWPPPWHGRSGVYVPRSGARPVVPAERVVRGPVLLHPGIEHKVHTLV